MATRAGGGSAIEMWRAEGSTRIGDARIQDEVWVKLYSVLAVRPGTLTVDVDLGVVRLGGAVSSYADKLTAASAAAQVPGVRRIENAIVVALAPEDARGDDALLSMVETALRWDSRTRSALVRASVCEGEVTLRGSVTSEQQRAAAQETVSRMVGVRGVVNRIVVQTRRAG